MAKRIIKPDSGNTLVLQEDNGSVDALTVETNGDVTLAGNFTSKGIDDNASTTALTIDSSGNITPGGDNTQDLGSSSKRWKDLYLSGGVYLGGTGAANYLDDYEEGDWTSSLKIADASTGGNESSTSPTAARYTKVGDLVTVSLYIANINTSGMTGATRMYITGLPFLSRNASNSTGTPWLQSFSLPTGGLAPVARIPSGSTYIQIDWLRDGTTDIAQDVNDMTSGDADIILSMSYTTAS